MAERKPTGKLNMIDAKIIDDLAGKLSQIMPPQAQKMHDEVQAQFKRVLQSTLNKMDVVTREEFDVQTRVLQKTREKLTSLEQRVTELENSSSS